MSAGRSHTGGWAVAFDPKAKRCASMTWHDDGSVTVELWNETERCTVRITATQAIAFGEALIKGTDLRHR